MRVWKVRGRETGGAERGKKRGGDERVGAAGTRQMGRVGRKGGDCKGKTEGGTIRNQNH